MLRTLVYVFLIFRYWAIAAGSDCDVTGDKTTEAALRRKLLCNYNRSVRPVKNHSETTDISLSFRPMQIYLDDEDDIFVFHGQVQYEWNDQFMKWDPEEHDNIEFLSMSVEDIWMPTVITNEGTDEVILDSQFSNEQCMVWYWNRVHCAPLLTMKNHCWRALMKYPFDEQHCVIWMMSITHRGNQINLTLPHPPIKYDLFVENKLWQLIRVRSSNNIGAGNITYVILEFVLQRHSAGEVAITIVPGIVLSCLTLLTFFMNELHSSRIFISTFTALCNILYCLYCGYKLSGNEHEVPLIVAFFRNSFAVSGIAAIAAVLNQNLRRNTTSPPMWLVGIINKLEGYAIVKMLFLEEANGPVNESTAEIAGSRIKISKWTPIATALDRLLFLISLSIYIIFCLSLNVDEDQDDGLTNYFKDES